MVCCKTGPEQKKKIWMTDVDVVNLLVSQGFTNWGANIMNDIDNVIALRLK